MADEITKPWYKDTRYLGLIIASVAILVTIIIYIWPIPPPPPSDFSISIDPMLGAIQAGGVIQMTVSVMGISGYDHTVSLSATGQPFGVVIAFVPPFEEAKPSYTSSVMINVDKNVPAGDYPIIIKGTGADGKEHTCSYILTIKPFVIPTVTPTPIIVDNMNGLSGWERIPDYKGSSIDVQSVHGLYDNAIEISYDLKEDGYVVISKEIDPEILTETEGLNFYYKGSGKPNTIEFKLVYGKDFDETTYGILWNKATIVDNWIFIEVPYNHFSCWWPENNCERYGNKLDVKNVRKIEFAISNKPNDGDMYGSGWLIIDEIQGSPVAIT